MTNKLTIKQITDAAQSFMCQVFNADLPNDVAPFVTIQGPESRIVQAITSLIEAATFDANIECGKSIERQKYWRNRSVEANTELSEAWGDYAAMKTERDELRKQLADSKNTVAQLRAARDKRKPECVRAIAGGIYDRRTAEMRVDGSVLLRDPVTGKAWTADGVRVERKTVTAQDAISEVMAAMHEDELCGDGWIEFDGGEWPVEPGIPHQAKMKSGKVCDVRYNPKIWGMPQGDDPVTHYRLVKKEEKPKQDDGWIEWHGGECPVTGHTLVRVRLRGGFESAELDRAGSFEWMDCGGHGAIIAYKPAK